MKTWNTTHSDTTLGQWVETLELGEQSPSPIISYYTSLLERVRRTNDEIEIEELRNELDELEGKEITPDVPLAGAALGGLHCVAPAQRATEAQVKEHQQTGDTEMAKEKKSQIRSNVVVSDVGTALKHAIEPVIKTLDEFHYNRDDNSQSIQGQQGHELPSRKDLTLRIFLSNLCYNVHTQIHGTPGKFGGIKTSYDKAQQAWASLVDRYADRPEDLEADPNCTKFFQWTEETGAKMQMLQSLYTEFTDVYRSVTGEAWAPRTTENKAAVDPNRAAKMLAAVKAARQAKAEISEESTLIKAQVS